MDRLESYNQKIGDNTILKLEYGYDLENRLTSETWYFPGSNAYVNSYTYNDDGTVQGMGSGVMGTGYTYDGLGRLTRIDSEIDKSVREYTYRDLGNGKTTSQVTKLNYPHLLGGYTFEYTYDVNGNIASYATGYTSDGNRITDSTEYTYDAQNQLVRAEGSQIYTYTYNSGGNLVTAFDGTKTHTYSYYAGSWGDLLQYYDGQEIVYDWMGNPTSYYNGTRWTFTWQNGRELTRAAKTGTEVNYTYDADGMRKTKTVNGVTHTYYYTGGKLLREVYDGTILDFFYDANGTPIAMRQSAVGSTNYTIYYYITNLQGDVIRLVDHLGQTAAYYRYDPYGKVIEASGSHANINPLRYRGYVYDTESGLYYCQSRYYDPQICRFINADVYVATGQGLLGNNMFVYCGNNPVNGCDPLGLWTFSISFGYDITLFFFGISRTINFAIDDNWNFAIQTTHSAPTYTSDGETSHLGIADIGVGVSVQLTDDDTVYDLEGSACNAGFSVGDGPYAGVDMVYSGAEMFNEDDADRLPNGISFTVGFGAGMDAHFKQTQTNTLFAINLMEGH